MNGACLILVYYATINCNDKNYKLKLYKGNFVVPFYGWGSTASGESHFKEAVHFLPLSSQKS